MPGGARDAHRDPHQLRGRFLVEVRQRPDMPARHHKDVPGTAWRRSMKAIA